MTDMSEKSFVETAKSSSLLQTESNNWFSNLEMKNIRLMISSTLSCDFWPLTWFPMIWEWFWWFCEVITGKNILEEIESIMGACAEQNSPLWVSIPQNRNSLRWTPRCSWWILYICSWRHVARHGIMICVCQFESITASVAHSYGVLHHAMQCGHAIPYLTGVCEQLVDIQ